MSCNCNCNCNGPCTDPGGTHGNTWLTSALDSRSIGFGDAFGQRFMRPGTYRYGIVPAGTGAMIDAWPFTIDVEKADGSSAMEQHNVVVTRVEGRFEPDVAALTIREGDLVVWACPQAGSGGFEVRGDKAFFGSGRLTNECGYSHAFATPGDHHWVDAFGSDLGGVVHVEDIRPTTPEEFARWRKRVATGTLVLIADGKAEPAEVRIVTGQTVFFAIVTGDGISITDHRLLAGRTPQPPPSKPASATKRPAAKRTPAKRAAARR